MPARLDLTASRNVAWAPTIDLFYPGEDIPLSGASICMEVRHYPGAPGEPIARIEDVPFEDMAATAQEPRRRLRLFPTISKVALGLFPSGLNLPEPGEADAFSYDVILTYSEGSEDKLALGHFILEPGVTLP